MGEPFSSTPTKVRNARLVKRRVPVKDSSETTSTSTSSDVWNAQVTRDRRMSRSPILTGCRNSTLSTDAVTTRLRVWRRLAIAPARSIRCITDPPSIKPAGLASLGKTTWTVSVAESSGRRGLRWSVVTSVAPDQKGPAGRSAVGSGHGWIETLDRPSTTSRSRILSRN